MSIEADQTSGLEPQHEPAHLDLGRLSPRRLGRTFYKAAPAFPASYRPPDVVLELLVQPRIAGALETVDTLVHVDTLWVHVHHEGR